MCNDQKYSRATGSNKGITDNYYIVGGCLGSIMLSANKCKLDHIRCRWMMDRYEELDLEKQRIERKTETGVKKFKNEDCPQ